MAKLPALPDDDADFTPDLARKIIAKYQELLSIAIDAAFTSRCGEVDPTRPACGQGDEWGHKPTDISSPESEVRGQAHRDAISPSGGLTSVEAQAVKKGEDK